LRPLLLSLPLLFLFACGTDTYLDEAKSASPPATCYQLPTGTHLSRLNAFEDLLMLSYVKSGDPKDTLQTIVLGDDEWSAPNTFAYGENWFINWADYPSVVYVNEGLHGPVFFYHFLEYSGEGTYDYDIKYGQTGDKGIRFESAKLHKDGISAEHGFLSSARLPGGDLQVSWLDGRNTKVAAANTVGVYAEQSRSTGAKDVEGHGHGHGGAMSLRTKALSDSTSVELDNRVCDCCGTATAVNDELTMVAYRDRSDDEVRDISYVVKPHGGEWSAPLPIHQDGWEISGCPVNGPALAASGADIVAAWYTEADDEPAIKFSWFNHTGNQKFSDPITLPGAKPLGRVDVQLSKKGGTAYITGLTATENPDSAALMLWTVDAVGNKKQEQLGITAAARSSGFPKTALFQDRFYWAKTVIGKDREEQFVEVCWK
jgi:hypothetical protein